ncbi:hypothetical protein GCM10010435_69790 [Winogradskya consettensis]|uniref:Uncharacterized protein n=1 Tax=Winogradskya consettensis TaxID=113560 RepID=A0A919SQ93_9ACTN|nr:hypothetical protein [Actinoplanes consettensis]GIM75619.1 hypothetical protein Aco04nite_46310 [Actinoplanes consettensis]
MPAGQILETARDIAPFVAVAGIVAGCVTSVLRTWIVQAARTRRFDRALEGSRPHQRREIIVACSQLEGRPPAGSDGGTVDTKLPAPRSLMPGPRAGRRRERQRS